MLIKCKGSGQSEMDRRPFYVDSDEPSASIERGLSWRVSTRESQ
jgi:hypothetical protein